MILAEWTAHPARRRPRDVALVAAVVLLTAGAVIGTFQSLFLGALSVGMLVVAVAPFLLPTRYQLSDLGIVQQRALRTRSRSWSDLRRLAVGTEAALVSPFARPHALERLRGFVVLFDGADRDEIVRILRQHVDGSRAEVAAPAESGGAA